MALGYCLKTEHGSTVSLRQQSCQLLALLHNLLPVTIKRLLPQSNCIAAIRHSQYVACYRPADFPHRHLEVMDDFALPAAIGLLSPGYHLQGTRKAAKEHMIVELLSPSHYLQES
eukprot:GHUV01051393.1.p1 GENE.GHUV01051393.1~~GHUV01051393.1.p1  ORF type:complete len:115 (+),score=26.10 GHUV01051393.1:874-1218(+)